MLKDPTRVKGYHAWVRNGGCEVKNSPRNVEEKPYNACIDCTNLGTFCDGPNFLAMTIDRWVDWCRLRKAYLGWTSQQLADRSGVALGSIERIFAGRTKDPMLSTVQLITKALVNGTWGQYPCADPSGSSQELAAECQQLRKDLADMIEKKEHFKRLGEERWELLEQRREFLASKDVEIKELKQSKKWLVACLALSVILMFLALATDAVFPLL